MPMIAEVVKIYTDDFVFMYLFLFMEETWLNQSTSKPEIKLQLLPSKTELSPTLRSWRAG